MPADDTAPDPLIGSVVGKCLLTHRLGRGGMGDVYLAKHRLLKKNVAVKLLPRDFSRDEEAVVRFHREAVAAAKLDHPNTVQIHDVGEDAGRHYIIMQYVEGKSLQDIIDEIGGPMDVKEAARIVQEAARGLKAAHEQGIVHRDIKPANILLSDKGEVKITDFGLAFDVSVGNQVTKDGVILGTPHFISPEQADGRYANERSDLYSLGIVFYYMVTGARPFEAKSQMGILYKHIHEDPLPPSERNPNVSPLLQRVILRLLAKDPNDRYQIADELIQDLDRFIQSAPSGRHRVLVPIGARRLRSTRQDDAPSPRPFRSRTHPSSSRITPRRRSSRVLVISLVAGLVASVSIGLAVALSGKDRSKESPEEQSPAGRPTVSPKEDLDRIREKLEAAKEEEDWKAAKTRDGEEDYRGYLRRRPKGRHAREAREALERWTVRPPNDPGFQFLPIDGDGFPRTFSFCTHVNGAFRFSGHELTVDYAPSGDEKGFHWIWTRRNDIAECRFRGDIYVERGRPGIVSRLPLKDTAEEGRTGHLTWPLDDAPLLQWVPFELRLDKDFAELKIGDRVAGRKFVTSGTSRFGSVGFQFTGRARFKIRFPRIRVLSAVDLEKIRRDREEAAKRFREKLDARRRAAAEKLVGPERDRAQRDLLQIARDPKSGLIGDAAWKDLYRWLEGEKWVEVFPAANLDGWRTVKGTSDTIEVRGGMIVLKPAGLLSPPALDLARGLAMEIEYANAGGTGTIGFLINRRGPRTYSKVVLTGEEARIVSVVEGRETVVRRRALPVSPRGRWIRLTLATIGDMTCFYLDGRPLLASGVPAELFSAQSGIVAESVSARLRKVALLRSR